MSEVWQLAALIMVVALLYSSVGHAGASGYLAVMALFNLQPDQMRPTAFVLNIIVATLGTIRFYRAGFFSWRLFLAFTTGSIPLAYLGGFITLPTDVYRPVVGVILLLSALRLFVVNPIVSPEQKRRVPLPVAVLCGGAIGFLAGLTSTGGGIFLSPLLLLTRWAATKETSGVTVAFILANSVAGLLGLLQKGPTLPDGLPIWAGAAIVGALVGSELGSKRLGNRTLLRLLGVVLVIAGLKMIFL